MRLLVLLLLSAGCMSNGHSSHDTLTVENSTPTQGGDVSWWCFRVSGEKLKPLDGRESCERSRTACDEVRQIALGFGLSATDCRPVPQAVCFTAREKVGDFSIERCFETGEECERVYREVQKQEKYMLGGCAIQANQPTRGGTI